MHRLTPFRMGTLGLLRLLALAPLLTLWGTATARPAQAAPIEYAAALSGAAESPPVASAGTGNARVELDTAAHTLRVRVTFSGLTGNSTNAHIHAPTAVAGTGTAGVATQTPTFLGFPSGVTSGTYDATFDTTLAGSWNPAYITANGGTPAGAEAALATALAAGKAYLNVHSTFSTSGEIRGFLTPPAVGGRGLAISTPNDGDFWDVKLTWQAGNVQAGYVLLKHNTATAVTNLINLSAAASSYLDLPVVNETYCYILAPVDIAGAPLGLSDLQCARPGFEIGTVAADNFTLALNQSSNATLTWLVPPDGVDTYTLWRITLDGAPPTSVTLPGSALDSVQPVAASGTCFQLLGEGGPGTGSTNILCGVPGVSSLNSSKLSVAALQTLMADALRNGGSIGQ